MPISQSIDSLLDPRVCQCSIDARSACTGLPVYKLHGGKRYCVLHYPGKEKGAEFTGALRKKLDAEDWDFSEVWFSDTADFSNRTFFKPANFAKATFSADAHFNSTIFRAEANFRSATFSARADFSFATFSAAANFSYTTFGATAEFNGATFKDQIRFEGDPHKQVFSKKSSLNLQLAKIENPARLSFHTLSLRTHWFVNVDARSFEFINVDWNWRNIKARREIKSYLNSPLNSLLSRHVRRDRWDKKGRIQAYRLLAIACRNLAVNAEENHRYEEASKFRYIAMDARRLERWGGFTFWTLGWWYWLASGYGERVWRAFLVLIGVWVVASALYTQVGFVRWEPRVSSEPEAWEARRDEVGQPLRWQRALTYSLGVMALQKPEPKPATDAAHAVVMLETILGPVQAALLALAIRRKFMR